jgi:hypothetical protein
MKMKMKMHENEVKQVKKESERKGKYMNVHESVSEYA